MQTYDAIRAEGVFVGSGIFKSGNPMKRAQAIVKAVATTRCQANCRAFGKSRRGNGWHK